MCYCTSPLRVHPYSYYCLTQYPSTSRDDSCSNVQNVASTIDFRVKTLNEEANSCLGDRNRSATKKVWRASSISSGQRRPKGVPTISHYAGSFWSSRGPSLSETDRNQVYFIMSLLDPLSVNHPGCPAIPSLLLLPQGWHSAERAIVITQADLWVNSTHTDSCSLWRNLCLQQLVLIAHRLLYWHTDRRRCQYFPVFPGRPNP